MSERSAGRFLTARWSRLAMINYEIDPGILRGRAPQGTEVDTWNGRCFVSMVGFRFLDTRVLGVAVPFHRNFVEVNLRYYVRRTVDRQVRRGVVFVKELVPRRALAWVANLVYNEHYQAVPMSSEDTGDLVAYAWTHRGRANRMSVSVRGDSYLPSSDSEESFITEHYWGYVAQRDGSTLEYRVEHPPWRVWRAYDPTFECDAGALYGAELALALRGKPSSSFLAAGSDIAVHRGVKLSPA